MKRESRRHDSSEAESRSPDPIAETKEVVDLAPGSSDSASSSDSAEKGEGAPTTNIEDLVEALFAEEGLSLGVRPAEGPSTEPRPACVRTGLDAFQKVYQDGRYETLAVLKTGAMSALLQVWDRDLGRRLVLKTLRVDRNKDGTIIRRPRPKSVMRFLSEATITAQLDHPGIVPVYDLGIDEEGLPFFVMRQVKGQDLTEIFRLARRRVKGWTDRRVLGVILRACQSVGYAHAKGIVHRDLKPENIMAAQLGQVYVMDWGLAKDLRRERIDPPSRWACKIPTGLLEDAESKAPKDSRSPLETLDGTVVGTPIYMPPEQARGTVREVGPRSDVYSLGAILYTLLTGHYPYEAECRGRPVSRVLEIVADRSPRSVRALNSNAPGPLVAICEKAMARRPAERYRSSAELAEELQACLYAGPAEPRHSSWLRRLGSSIFPRDRGPG